MHFSTATIVAALAANVLAVPVPQIGGEAQACQGLVDGVTNGVGQGGNAALDNTAATLGGAKGAARRLRLFRRQGTGLAAACYDVVNNVDQGTGYAAQNIQAGAVGDEGGECTGDCAVGNAKRQAGDLSQGVQDVADAAGAGQATSSVTGTVSSTANSIDDTENSVGAEAGTAEADVPADTGAEIGNAIGSAASGSIPSTGSTGSTGNSGNSGSGNPPANNPPPKGGNPPPGGPKGGAPPPHRRQLNKIAAGTQDVGDAIGLGNEVAPVVDAEDNIDGVGTSGVGDAGKQVGGTIQDSLVKAGSSVPKL